MFEVLRHYNLNYLPYRLLIVLPYPYIIYPAGHLFDNLTFPPHCPPHTQCPSARVSASHSPTSSQTRCGSAPQAVGGCALQAVGSWRLCPAGGWRLCLAGSWRLAVVPCRRLAVSGSPLLAVGRPGSPEVDSYTVVCFSGAELEDSWTVPRI